MCATPELIEENVNRWTEITVARLSQNERTRLLHIVDELHKWDVVRGAVAEVVLRNRSEMGSDCRPLGRDFLATSGDGIRNGACGAVLRWREQHRQDRHQQVHEV